MKLVGVINDFLRDRDSLYATAKEGRNLPSLCGKLLLIFFLTAGIYGGVMGGFRCIHPAFYFSDFAISAAGQSPVQGKVAGMSAENQSIYTRTALPPSTSHATIRFNLSKPSEPYEVAEIGFEKGYGKILLAPGSVLQEPDAWKLPFIVALKIPLLFILTLLVCALALYALNLAFGMRLHFMPAMTVMLFALAGTGVLLAVFAPIAMLFTVVTASYHFMKMFHVLVFAAAGLFGLKILAGALASMRPEPAAGGPPPLSPPRIAFGGHQPEAGAPAGLPNSGGNPPREIVGWGEGRKLQPRRGPLLAVWLLVYCLVGTQLAWTLKPFLGTPYLPETPPFRIESGNIFVSTLESMRSVGER